MLKAQRNLEIKESFEPEARPASSEATQETTYFQDLAPKDDMDESDDAIDNTDKTNGDFMNPSRDEMEEPIM